MQLCEMRAGEAIWSLRSLPACARHGSVRKQSWELTIIQSHEMQAEVETWSLGSVPSPDF